MLVTAVVHLALVSAHAREDPKLAKLFALNGALFIALSIAAFTWRWWRPAAATLLVLTILAYISHISNGKEDPDQVGIATKLVELVALGLVIVPARDGVRSWSRRLRWVAVPVAVLTLCVLTGISVWGAAVRAARADASTGMASGHDHRADHHDAIAAPISAGTGTAEVQTAGTVAGMDMATGHHHGGGHPGMVLQPVPSTPPTAAQRAAAAKLAADTKAAVAKYEDLSAALADGYRPGTPPNMPTVHYVKWANFKRDAVLDPNNPEELVYANTKHGPVLLGAVYVMHGRGEPGPDIGGSLTQWHMHDNVCFAPNGMVVGLLSAFATCPAGSFNVPTAEILHVWTIDNPVGAYGDLDPAWLARLIAR
jgi:hypothetical protein